MKKFTSLLINRGALLLIPAMFLSATISLAQVSYMENEVAHQISNKAEQGYLGDVVMDDAKKVIPNAKIYSIKKITGKNNKALRFTGTPENITTANTTTKHSIILTKPPVT